MTKTQRHNKIKDLIQKMDIDTQNALADQLNACGFNVTQATVSRDIKELGLVKVLAENGGYKYALPVKTAETMNISTKVINVFCESVLSIDCSQNIVVIKTLSGSANAAGTLIDKLNMPEILGCIAGDDTIFVVVSSTDVAPSVVDKLKKIVYLR